MEETENIQVAIRIRPMLPKEAQKKMTETLKVEDNLVVVYDPVDGKQEGRQRMDVYHRSREQCYAFDHIFTHHDIEEIYQRTAMDLVDSLYDGFNGCVFAYGATGTGKTFTMIGNSEQKGMVQICLDDIFEKRKQMEANTEIRIKIQFVEIYNEQIKDLLEPEKSSCSLRDDPVKGVTVQGAKKLEVSSTEQVSRLVQQGNQRRSTEKTDANEASSRSHAILQIKVKVQPRLKSVQFQRRTAKLSLVDLAGSERGTVTQNKGERMREGAKINQSLLALANCINALGDKSKKGQFISYRDSKLT